MGLCWETRDYNLRSGGTREIIPGSGSLVSTAPGRSQPIANMPHPRHAQLVHCSELSNT